MVVGDETLNPFSITDGLAGLVRKSVVSLRPSDGRVAYRLLESVRLYALEKLSAANEIDRVRQLHMGYLLDLLETATTEWTFTPRSQWLATYGAVLDDVRSALAWAFADPEDISSGVLLTTLAMPIGLQLGLVDEFRLRIETAIAASRRARKAELVAEMRLNLVYGILNQNQIHPNSASAIGIERAVELAEEIDSDLYRIEPQIVLGSYSMGMGDYPKALGHASRAHALSATVNDDIALLASRRILSQVTHFSGQHAKAVDLAYTVLQHPLVNIPVAFGSVQTDRRISMRIVLARSRWMQGFADEAYSIANEAIAIAPEDGPLALCQALSLGAVPLLLWRGDREEARSRSEILIDQASRYTLRHWHSWGLLFQAVLGDQDSRDRLSIAPQGGLQRETVATFTGRLEDSFVENDVVQASWSAPEHLRLLGERALAANLPDHVATAEWFFLSSRALAISHGALAWELRATSSLARLWRFTPRRVEGMDQLGAVLSRFIEGHSTVDVKTANSLLRSIEEQ